MNNNDIDIDKARLLDDIQAKKNAHKSKLNIFMGKALVLLLIIGLLVLILHILVDSSRAKKQIEKNVEAALNSPKMQAQRAKEARRQRELAKQRRLRQLGIDGISKPMQKNDLLNQQLSRQEIAKEQELIESQKPQEVDYTSQLAAYNARLKEVQAEEARLRAQAEAAARAQAKAEAAAKAQASREQAEQLRLEQERQAQEQRLLAEERARQKAEEQARLAREKAERERAAKAKAAQEAAAKAAKLKAQVNALKTQKNTLQTRSNTPQAQNFAEQE